MKKDLTLKKVCTAKSLPFRKVGNLKRSALKNSASKTSKLPRSLSLKASLSVFRLLILVSFSHAKVWNVVRSSLTWSNSPLSWSNSRCRSDISNPFLSNCSWRKCTWKYCTSYIVTLGQNGTILTLM